MKNMIRFLKVITFVTFFILACGVQKANALDTSLSESITQHNDSTTVAMPTYVEPMQKDTTTTGGGKSTGNANIFAILRAKIYSTLVDLRRIVYVIAGFGLVMFAVLAIFNKVSYKHLGYIMISLCLLSLMFPFLEYFSGAGTIQKASQTEMDFKNFLDTKYAVIVGTDGSEIESAMNGTGTSQEGTPACGPDGCDNGTGDSQLDALANKANPYGEEEEEERVLSVQDLYKSEAAGCNVVALNGTGTSNSAWNKDTATRNVCTMDANGKLTISVEQCSGKMNKTGDKCVKTAAQVWSDIVHGATATSNFIASGVNTVTGVAATGAALVSGGVDIVNAAQNLGNAQNLHDVLAGLQNLAGTTGSAISSVNVGFQSVLGGLGGAANSVGALATIASTNPDSNLTGSNSVATGAANFNQDLSDVNQGVSGTLGTATTRLGEASGVVRDADNAVTNVEAGVSRFKGYGERIGQVTGSKKKP